MIEVKNFMNQNKSFVYCSVRILQRVNCRMALSVNFASVQKKLVHACNIHSFILKWSPSGTYFDQSEQTKKVFRILCVREIDDIPGGVATSLF